MRSSQSFTLVRATMSFVFKIAFLLVFGPAVCDNEPGDNKTAVEATTLVQNSNKTIFASWRKKGRMLAEVRALIAANSSNVTAEFEKRFGTAAASQPPSFAENSVADNTHTDNKGVAGIAASNSPPFVEKTMADSTVAYDKHIPGTAAATPPPSLVENRGAENKSETTENVIAAAKPPPADVDSCLADKTEREKPRPAVAEAASPPTSFAETHVAVKSLRNGDVQNMTGDISDVRSGCKTWPDMAEDKLPDCTPAPTDSCCCVHHDSEILTLAVGDQYEKKAMCLTIWFSWFSNSDAKKCEEKGNIWAQGGFCEFKKGWYLWDQLWEGFEWWCNATETGFGEWPECQKEETPV